jgi:site-specific DNA-cytosine methylase
MITDACDINWVEVPKFTTLTSSPPCQDYSKWGKGEGLKGKNGPTTPAVLDAMEVRKPLASVTEQVIGFKSLSETGSTLTNTCDT